LARGLAYQQLRLNCELGRALAIVFDHSDPRPLQQSVAFLAEAAAP
jgi:hypothetical protein